MKAFILGIVLTACFAGYASAATRHDGESVVVKLNGEKRATQSKITVRFVEMIEDSRCPRDVQCIQAGNAKIKVRLTRNGRSQVMELNTNAPNQPAAFAGYELKLLRLSPQPASNIRIDRNGYVATITLSRSGK